VAFEIFSIFLLEQNFVNKKIFGKEFLSKQNFDRVQIFTDESLKRFFGESDVKYRNFG